MCEGNKTINSIRLSGMHVCVCAKQSDDYEMHFGLFKCLKFNRWRFTTCHVYHFCCLFASVYITFTCDPMDSLTKTAYINKNEQKIYTRRIYSRYLFMDQIYVCTCSRPLCPKEKRDTHTQTQMHAQKPQALNRIWCKQRIKINQ